MLTVGYLTSDGSGRSYTPASQTINACAEAFAKTIPFAVGRRGNDEANNQTVETQRFRKNQDQDQSDKQFGLLCIRSHTSITDHTDRETCGQGAQANCHTRTEMRVA